MSNVLDTAYEKARQAPLPQQEMLGRVLESAGRGENLPPVEVERRHRNDRTRAALAQIENGEHMSVEEARARLATLRQSRLNAQ